MDYAEIVQWLSSRCREHQIDWLLVGGWALGAYGVSRETVDLDILICEDDFELLHRLLSERGYRATYRSPLFARMHSDVEANPELDVLFVERQTVDALARECQPFALAGTTVNVPSLRHLIAMKWHAVVQDRQTRMAKDLLDIVSLLSANGLDARSAEFKALALKYADEELYGRLLSLLGPSPEDSP